MQETVQTWMGFSSEPLSCAARSSRAPWPCVGPTPPPAAIHGFPRSAHEGTVRRRAPHTPPPPMHVRPRLGERDARAGLIGDGRPRGSGHDSLDSRPTARRWLIASPIFCHTPIAHPSADAPILHGHMRPISNALWLLATFGEVGSMSASMGEIEKFPLRSDAVFLPLLWTGTWCETPKPP
jgi:hypothetical protein